MEALAVVGPGQLGRLFAGGALALGAVVHPLRRGDDVGEKLARVPAGSPILVATGETALHDVAAAVPPARRGDIVLVQNELFPHVWRSAGLARPTVLVVWLSQKAGRATEVARESEIAGPHAQEMKAVFDALRLPARVVDDGELVTALIAKYAFILAINALGLERDVTVGEHLADDPARVAAVTGDALRLATALYREGLSNLPDEPAHAVDERRARAMAAEAMEALRGYPAKGRTAAARLERARADAQRLRVELAALLG